MRNNNELKRLQDKVEWYKACVKAQAERIKELEREVINLKAKIKEEDYGRK